MNISDIIQDPKEVPSLPAVFYQLMECVNDPEKTMDDFGALVKTDPGLSVQILKIVNSTIYNFPERIDSLSHAIGVIGTEQLLNMVLSVLLIENFNGIPEEIVTMESFWSHSVATAMLAEELASICLPQKKEQMFLAGLLHDLGSLVLYKYRPDQIKIAIERSLSWGVKLPDTENIALGFNHAELASSLFEQWGIPEVFIETTLFHHDPTKAREFSDETDIIYLADHIAMGSQLGSSGENDLDPFDKTVLKKHGLTEKVVADISEKTIQSFENVFEIFFSKQNIS